MQREQQIAPEHVNQPRGEPASSVPALFLPTASEQILQLQRTIGNRAVGSFLQPKLKGPETEPADDPVTRPLIVEDEAPSIEPGQMRKGDFLNQLEAAVTVTADDAMSGAGMSEPGSPEIAERISTLREQDSQQVERSMRRYAPEATNATDLLRGASERVRSAADEWKRTGEVAGGTEDLLELGGVGSAFSALAGGIGGAISGIFHKRKGGATDGGNSDPEQIRGQLGDGHSLDGGVQSRMGAAFGHDFSQVRVHTDSRAAGLSDGLNARAFTIGSDIAFGGGEYRPGTLIGDALIAHELAHVVQQRGGNVGTEASAKGQSNGGNLEEDADLSAVGVMVRLWGGTTNLLKETSQEAVPRMRSGLQLQTCCKCRATPMSAAGSPLSLTTLETLTPWQLSQIPENDLECAAGSPAPGRPAVTDYVRARLLAVRNLTFDIDTPPGPGRDPSPEELTILDRDFSQLLATSGVQASMGDRGGHGPLPTAEGGTPTLRGRVRLATVEGLGAARYRLNKFLNLLTSGAEALQLSQQQNIPRSGTPIATQQERAVADYYKHAHAPPVANGLYQVQEDRIYVLDTNLTDPSNAFVARHEAAHLISGGERVRQAFIRRFGSQWLPWWEAFNEGIAELITIESLPPGQAPPPAPTYTSPSGVVVEGARYEGHVELMRTITADPANRELFFRAFFSGEIPERVFELLAQARNQRLPEIRR